MGIVKTIGTKGFKYLFVYDIKLIYQLYWINKSTQIIDACTTAATQVLVVDLAVGVFLALLLRDFSH